MEVVYTRRSVKIVKNQTFRGVTIEVPLPQLRNQKVNRCFFWFNNLKRDLSALKTEMSELKRSNQEILEGNKALNKTLVDIIEGRQSLPAGNIHFGVPFMPRQNASAGNGPNNGANEAPASPIISKNKFVTKWLSWSSSISCVMRYVFSDGVCGLEHTCNYKLLMADRLRIPKH